jgi:TfoX/Sxy family transcriptional regulator of competence genes
VAFDEELAERVRSEFARRSILFDEKKMMGGLCFMVDGKMCVGIAAARLMVRLDPAIYEQALLEPGCVPMDFTGKPMRGFVFVEPIGTASSKSLRYWIDLALEFNPRAKSSRSKMKPSSRSKKASRKRSPGPRRFRP